MAATSKSFAGDRPIDEELLREIGVGRTSVAKTLLLLLKNEVETVGNLCSFTSEEKLERLKAKNDQGEEVALGAGTVAVLWRFIEKQKSSRMWTHQDVFEFLDNRNLPTEASRFELPFFAPEGATAEMRAFWRNAGIRASTSRLPDMLISCLEKPVVKLVELEYVEESHQHSSQDSKEKSVEGSAQQSKDAVRRLSVTMSSGERHVEVKSPELGVGKYVALVGTSGAGKTRFLFEQAHQAYACLLWPSGNMGAWDFPTLLSRSLQLNTTEDKATVALMEGTKKIIHIRCLVLKYLRTRVQGFGPKHWLAVQMNPSNYLGMDVFDHLFKAIEGDFDHGQLRTTLFEDCGMKFVAIDEAQVFDGISRLRFPGRSAPDHVRNALGPIVDSLEQLNTGVVLSGTGLSIIGSIRILISSVAKREASTRLIYGVTNYLKVSDLRRIIQERCGPQPSFGDAELIPFTGRPRFGMRLVEGLMLGIPLREILSDLVSNLRSTLDKCSQRNLTGSEATTGSKTLMSEILKAACATILKNKPGITVGGEAALELGVCRIASSPLPPTKRLKKVSTFVIDEPLVLRAIESRLQFFKEITMESDEELGRLLEEFVAWSAGDIVDVVNRFSGGPPVFAGRWELPPVRGDRLRGNSAAAGDEPNEIQALIDEVRREPPGGCKYLLFPSTAFGADLVIVARHASRHRRVLLLLVQCKARNSASTPKALESLQRPYFSRSAKEPTVADGYQKALSQLDRILEDEDIATAHVVFKYPANSTIDASGIDVADFEGYRRHSPHNPESAVYTKTQILQIVLDRTSVPRLMTEEVIETLSRLERVKLVDRS